MKVRLYSKLNGVLLASRCGWTVSRYGMNHEGEVVQQTKPGVVSEQVWRDSEQMRANWPARKAV
jgi:hypothetical protein